MKMLLEFLKRRGVRSDRRVTSAVTPAPMLMALEPRIVYDASIAAVGMAQHHVEVASHASAPRPAFAPTNETAAAVEPHTSESTPDSPARSLAQASREAGAAARTEQVVFINANVANYQTLLTGLPPGTRYVVLNTHTDGLQQIADYLHEHPGIDAVHLVSHGADGEVQVGSTWLNEADLSAHSATLVQIGAAMKPGGDFLIYGCDVAQHADGQALVQQIASISHLHVAASTDATGAAALGGDWTLEYAAGAVHTPVIFSKAAEQQYQGLLAAYDETYDAQVGFDTGPTPITTTSLDGLIYTGDQPVEWSVISGSLPNSPSGGEFVANVQGTAMSTMTVQRQDGSLMAVQSFDIDIGLSTRVTVEALDSNGLVIGSVVLDITNNGGSSLFHVNLSGNAAFSQVKSVEFVESSGNYLSPVLDNFTYIAPSSPPVLTATGGNTSFVAGDNTASTPVAVDSGITLTDGNAYTAASATVSIAGNLHSSEDVLSFTNTSAVTYGNILASYNGSTGTLTLTSSGGTATIAQWQSALRAVTYTDTAITPNSATRTVSFEITSDGYTSSNTTSKSITVTDTDQTPIVSTTGVTTVYRAGSAATTIDSGIAVHDLDNSTQLSATVSIGSGFHSGDTLNFTNNNATVFGNIAVQSYNATTGVLTLTSSGATATDAQWASALSAVMFSSTSTTYGDRMIAFATNDGSKTSAAATDTVSVTSPASITTDSGSASFVAGDNTASTPVAVDAGITVSDTVSSTLASARVAITNGWHSSEDVLAFTNDGATMGNIVASYDGATGVLSLTSAGATATLAQWQSALESVTYTDTAITPNNTTRTISFTAVDGAGNTSNTATRTVTVTDTDQTPIVATTGGTTHYVGGSSAVTIDGGISVSDRDNTTQSSATVSIGAGFHSGDTLLFMNTGSTSFGNIAASYDSATGVLTLTSSGATATDAQWANALSAVAFSSTSTTYGNRTISFATSDGTKTSTAVTDTVNVTAPPMLTTDAGSAAFVAGDNAASTPVAIDAGLTVTDGSAATLASATVSITGGLHSSEDVLAFTNDGATMGNIAVQSYNASTGVLTLTSSGATATLAQWQSALASVTYTDTAITPNNTTRTISFTVIDGANNTSSTATRTVTVTDTDQTPIVATTGGTTNYVGGTSAVTIDGGISVSDLDNATQSSATVSIGAGFHSGDMLTFVNTNSTTFGNIVGSYNAGTGVLTLTSSGATASNAQWSNALSTVTFSASASAALGNRTMSFTVNDGTKNSAAATDTVDVLGPPTITTDAGSAAFVAGDNAASTPVAIDTGLTVTDGSAPTLASATVAITGNFHSGEDLLGFTNTSSATYGNIAASYNPATGVLALTSSGASATLAQWQNALDSVTYTDTAITPNTATRTISFTVMDTGATTSNTATRTVTVADTDQTPVVTTSSGSAAFVSGDNTLSTPIPIDAGLALSDRDNTTLASATVAITGNLHSGEDVLAFVSDGTTMGNIAGSYNAATGVLTLTSSGATATLAQWQAALASITYTDTAITPNTATRTISFAVSDGTKTGVGTRTVTVTATDQTPVVTTPNGSVSFVAGDNTASTPVQIDHGITLSDRDNTTLASATVAITGNFHGGEDVLAFANDGATMGNIAGSYNAATGVLTLTSSGATATLAQWQAALDSVTYTDTAVTPNSATRTISFSVTDGIKNSAAVTRSVTVADTDQTPVVTTSSGSASFVAGDNTASTPVQIDHGITLSDRDNTTLASATVAITGNFHGGEDVLAFANDGATMGNIAGSYNAATGVLTLTSSGATATLAQWQAALDSVTYTDTAVTPNSATRTISFSVTDGIKNSAAVTRSVTVADTDQTPVVTTSAGAVVFGGAGHSTPVTIDPAITVSDRDNLTLTSATVSITAGFHAGEDQLLFVNAGATMGNITGSYDAAAGVLTLTSSGATATLAQWQAALAAVSYADTSFTAAAGSRTIAFVVNDGTVKSAAATRSITVNAGFEGKTFVPGAFVMQPTLPLAGATAAVSVSEPIVLNALAVEPVLDEPLLSFHTTTFTTPDARHSGHDVLGETQVGLSSWPAPTFIAAPFNLPVVSEHVHTAPGAAFTLPLMPWVGSDQRIVAVTQADGRPLPAWVRYDAATGQLRGQVPPHGHGPRELRVRVAMRDQQGHLLYREAVLDLSHGRASHAPLHRGEEHVPKATAKPSLSEQFERERRSFHVVPSVPARPEGPVLAARASISATHT